MILQVVVMRMKFVVQEVILLELLKEFIGAALLKDVLL
jgi:hypothetical protein